MKKLTTEEFIKRANNCHGNKYLYSKTEYKGALTKLKITCPIHGDFEQTPSNHLAGRGCPECGKLEANTKKKGRKGHTPSKETLEKLRRPRGSKARTETVQMYQKGMSVKDIALKRNVTEATVRTLLNRAGVSFGEKNAEQDRLTRANKFVVEAIDRHGDRFQYDLKSYKGYHHKMSITCPIHVNLRWNPRFM